LSPLIGADEVLIGGLFKKPTTLIIGKAREAEGVELMRWKKKERERKGI
jgi:hypothetical protein